MSSNDKRVDLSGSYNHTYVRPTTEIQTHGAKPDQTEGRDTDTRLGHENWGCDSRFQRWVEPQLKMNQERNT